MHDQLQHIKEDSKSEREQQQQRDRHIEGLLSEILASVHAQSRSDPNYNSVHDSAIDSGNIERNGKK